MTAVKPVVIHVMSPGGQKEEKTFQKNKQTEEKNGERRYCTTEHF